MEGVTAEPRHSGSLAPLEAGLLKPELSKAASMDTTNTVARTDDPDFTLQDNTGFTSSVFGETTPLTSTTLANRWDRVKADSVSDLASQGREMFHLDNLFQNQVEPQVKLIFFRRREGREDVYADKGIDLKQSLIPVFRWANLEQDKATLETELKISLNSVGGVPGECRVKLLFEFETFVRQNPVGYMANEGYAYRLPLLIPEGQTPAMACLGKILQKTLTTLANYGPKATGQATNACQMVDATASILDGLVLLSIQLVKTDLPWGKGFMYPNPAALMEVQAGLIKLSLELLKYLQILKPGKLLDQVGETLRLILFREELEIPNLALEVTTPDLQSRQNQIALMFLTLLRGTCEGAFFLVNQPGSTEKRKSLTATFVSFTLTRFMPLKLAILDTLPFKAFCNTSHQAMDSCIVKIWNDTFLDSFSATSPEFRAQKDLFVQKCPEFAATIMSNKSSILGPLAMEFLKTMEARYQIVDEFDILELPGFHTVFQNLLHELTTRTMAVTAPLTSECLLGHCLNQQTSTQIMYRLLESTK